MKRVEVKCAAPSYKGDNRVEPVEIVIGAGHWPDSTDEEVCVLGARMAADAKALFYALLRSLPGGTFDRLLGLMLAEKATHFIVPHWSEERKEVGTL